MLWFLALRLSQSDSYMDEIKIQTAWPKPVMAEISFSDFPLIFLLWIKFVIISRDIEMLLVSMSRNSLMPKREIGRAFPSHELGLAG